MSEHMSDMTGHGMLHPLYEYLRTEMKWSQRLPVVYKENVEMFLPFSIVRAGLISRQRTCAWEQPGGTGIDCYQPSVWPLQIMVSWQPEVQGHSKVLNFIFSWCSPKHRFSIA